MLGFYEELRRRLFQDIGRLVFGNQKKLNGKYHLSL